MKPLLDPVRLILAFCVLNLLALGGVTALWRGRDGHMHRASQEVADSYHVLLSLERVHTDVLDLETGQRGFALTGDDATLAPYTRSMASLDATLHSLHGETLDERLKAADAALYRAKREGRHRFHFAATAPAVPAAP